MRIIDAHAHIYPARIAPAAVKATAGFYSCAFTPLTMPIPDDTEGAGTAEDLLSREKTAGIDGALVFSCATSLKQVTSINTFIGEQCQKYPNLYGAGTMYIGFPTPEEECDRLLSMGLKGIKLHADIQRFAVDDEALFPLYEIMQDKGMFLVSHAGDYRYRYSNPNRHARLAKMFPRLKIVCAHFGGWSQWNEAMDLLKSDNIYFDTSSTIPYAGEETALKAFNAFDRTHIFFGTDYPMWDPKEELDRLLALRLDDETLENVLYRNFERFMGDL